jgi:hypothetical protein
MEIKISRLVLFILPQTGMQGGFDALEHLSEIQVRYMLPPTRTPKRLLNELSLQIETLI